MFVHTSVSCSVLDARALHPHITSPCHPSPSSDSIHLQFLLHFKCLTSVTPHPHTLQVYLSGSVSSQYLTALLMAAPLATGTEGIEIIIKDELVGGQGPLTSNNTWLLLTACWTGGSLVCWHGPAAIRLKPCCLCLQRPVHGWLWHGWAHIYYGPVASTPRMHQPH